MYDFVPVCETPSGHCVKSNVQLCDIKPPQFPAWFNSEKKSMLMKNCPSWKAYEENCKGGFDSPPWWVALIVITFLFITGLVIFLLYKKKRLKWASRVSDVSLQAKQMCCKHAVETSNTKSKDKDPSCPKGGGDKTQEIRDRVTGSQLEDNFGSPTPATEPYYYVLEERSSVVVIKNSPPEMGTFGRRVIPPYSPTTVQSPPPTAELHQ
ncbi:uncharacterized protein LOC135467731 [Liolophura sinensis]|uniref:uncharacterized protein LOC135467731 n=1 Tax=Liolophura sinensis TaxID=3198878 RepID=UPI0031595D1B